jgi:uncharacterized protein involved in outer membrane biogenesis
MKRRFILILCACLILGSAAYFYIDTVFLPVQFKQLLTTKAKTWLGRDVSIGAVDFRLFQGFIIENITVAREDNPNRPFIQIRKLTFNLLLTPIVRKKAVIIPTIIVTDPFIFISRDEDKTWNFSDLLAPPKTKDNHFLPILLRRLVLDNGEVQYADKSRGRMFFESVQHINMTTTLSLNKGARFTVSAQIPKRQSKMTVKGNYSLTTRNLTMQVVLDRVDLAGYLPLVYSSPPYLNLSDGVISSADFSLSYAQDRLQARGGFILEDTDARIGEAGQIKGAVHVSDMLLSWRDKKWHAKGRARIPSALVMGADKREWRGDITADLNLLTLFGENMTCQGNIKIDNARLPFGEDSYFKGNISAPNASLTKLDNQIRLQGSFNMTQTDLAVGPQISLKGDLATFETDLVWFPEEEGNRKIHLQSGFTMDKAQIILGKNISITGRINAQKADLVYDRQKVNLQTQGQTSDLTVDFAGGRTFQGGPNFSLSYQYDPAVGKPDYKADVELTGGSLTAVPYLENVTGLQGAVTFTPDHLQTDRLSFQTQGATVQIAGQLDHFNDPLLNLRASLEDVDLRQLLLLFPTLHEKIQIDLEGQSAVQAAYNGPAKSPSEAVIAVTAQLAGASVNHKKLHHPVTDVSGQLKYKKDRVEWDALRVKYLGRPYTLQGQLDNFSRPVIDTKITGDQIDLTAQLKVLRSAVQLTSLAGDYLNSHIDLRGDAHFFSEEDTDIDVRGKFTLDLRDLGVLMPRFRKTLRPLQPKGILAGEGIFKGKLKDWRNWQLALEAGAPQVTLKGYPLKDLSLRFTQRDLAVSRCDITAKIYGGKIKMFSSADLRESKTPFVVNLDLAAIDLARLREDRKLKQKNLAGSLSISAELTGAMDDWKNLTGEGILEIVDGRLWQWHILEGIAAAILIPEFKDVVFTEARGGFTIRKQKLYSNNARLNSDTVTLDGKGWIDADKNIDFNIVPTFSELAILQSRSIKKGPTAFVTQTDGYVNIKLTGTLDFPRYKVSTSPLKVIGKTTDVLKEGVRTILKEIF